jgi:hypothetical protein
VKLHNWIPQLVFLFFPNMKNGPAWNCPVALILPSTPSSHSKDSEPDQWWLPGKISSRGPILWPSIRGLHAETASDPYMTSVFFTHEARRFLEVFENNQNQSRFFDSTFFSNTQKQQFSDSKINNFWKRHWRSLVPQSNQIGHSNTGIGVSPLN